MSLDLGTLFGVVDMDTEPFDVKYSAVIRRFSSLGIAAERAGGQTAPLERGLAGVGTSSDTAATGLTRASTAMREAGVSASDAAAASRALAVAEGSAVDVTTELGLAMSRQTQAVLRASAAQGRLEALQATGNATASRLAGAQASVIAANDRVALSNERVRTSSAFSSTTVRGLIGEATGLTSAMEGIPTPVTVVAGALGKLGLVAGVTGAGIAAFSIDLAQKFQVAATRIHTQADATTQQVAVLSKGMLAMAGDVATTPAVLADAAFHIASVGQKSLSTAQQLKVLQIAAEGAKLGNADLVDVTNALDAAIVANMKGVQNYSQVMGVLNKTVGTGDMTMQQLADAFGPLGSTFKGFGVSIQQAGAALAVLGDNNIRGAQAGSQLRQSITALADPLKAGHDQLQAWGITSGNLSKQLGEGGLPAALDVLAQKLHAAGYTASTMGPILAEMFGKRGPQQGLSTFINQLDRFHGKLDTITTGGSTFASSWAGYTKTFSYNLDAARSALEALAIQLGDKLLPEATKALHWIATDGVADLERFGAWFKAHQADFEEWIHAAEVVIRPFVYRLKADLNLITAALDLLEGHWGAAWHRMGAAVDDEYKSYRAKIQAIIDVTEHLGSEIGSAATKAWHEFTSATNAGVNKSVAAARRLPGEVEHALGSLASLVEHVASSAWNHFASATQHGISDAVALARSLPHRVVAAVGDLSHVLFSAGAAVIGGFISGIESKVGDVAHVLGGITHKLTSWKGPPEVDAMILYGSGRLVLQGFIRGIDSEVEPLRARLAQITAQAVAIVQSTIATAVAPAVTDPGALAGTLGVDTSHAISLQQRANELQVSAKAADAAAAAAKRHAQQLSNEAHAAATAAANMTGATKADQAAKHAAEEHSRALATEARTASQAATAATNAATKATNAWNKAGQAAQTAAQKAADAANALVSNLASAADQMVSTVQSFISQISGDLTGDSSLSSIWQSLTGTDANGNPITPTLAGVNATLNGILASAQQFSTDLNQVVAEGGGQDLITQLAGMGTTAGDALAEQLLAAGPAAIAALSATMASIQTVAGTEAQSLANAFYGPGENAIIQFIDGLEAKFPALKKALQVIVNEIEASLGVATGTTGASSSSGSSGSTTKTTKTTKATKVPQLVTHGFGVYPVGFPHFAAGVRDFAGGLAMVGERGPELVTLPRGASVTAHGGTPRGSDGASLFDMSGVESRLDALNARVDRLAEATGQAVGVATLTGYREAGQAHARQLTRDARKR